MRILVVYGSKQGGTAGLATMVGDALTDLGHEVRVAPAAEVKDLGDAEAVIVGGSLYYFFSWHRDARAFLRRHRQALRQLPVWLFSSGPLDDSATKKDIPPIRAVRRAMAKIGARGHVTFGGRLEASNRSLPIGDWRDEDHVRRWAAQVSTELTTAVRAA